MAFPKSKLKTESQIIPIESEKIFKEWEEVIDAKLSKMGYIPNLGIEISLCIPDLGYILGITEILEGAVQLLETEYKKAGYKVKTKGLRMRDRKEFPMEFENKVKFSIHLS